MCAVGVAQIDESKKNLQNNPISVLKKNSYIIIKLIP